MIKNNMEYIKKLSEISIDKLFYYIASTGLMFVIAVYTYVSLNHVMELWSITHIPFESEILAVGTAIAICSSMIGTRFTAVTYLLFLILFVVEIFGNIYDQYLFIDVNNVKFIAWKELLSPMFDIIFEKDTDILVYRRVLAVINGLYIPTLIFVAYHIWLFMRQKYNNILEVEKTKVEPTVDIVEQKVTEDIEQPKRVRERKKFKSVEKEDDNSNVQMVDFVKKQVPFEDNEDTESRRIGYLKVEPSDFIAASDEQEEEADVEEGSEDVVDINEESPSVVTEITKSEVSEQDVEEKKNTL